MTIVEKNIPNIPYDVYESTKELVILIPLWGVKKESLQIKIEDYKLIVQGERAIIKKKDTLVPLKEECYRWMIYQSIDLPSQVYLDTIHSRLSPENILEIIVPKVLIPESIDIKIEG